VLTTSESFPLAALRTCVWALSNLVRGKPAPPLAAVSSALPILAELAKVDDEEVLTDVCWALSYVGERAEGVDAVIDTGVCGRLASLLGTTSPTVQKSALHAVGNIVAGSQLQAQAALDGGALVFLTQLLGSEDAEVQRLAAWAISNVTAGSCDQIQAVIHMGAVPPLMALLRAPSRAVRKEAAFALVNVTTSPWPQHTLRLVEQGVVPPLCELLSPHEPADIITVALEGLQNILKIGEGTENSCNDNSGTTSIMQNQQTDQRGKERQHFGKEGDVQDDEPWQRNEMICAVRAADGKARMIALRRHHRAGAINSISSVLLKTYFCGPESLDTQAIPTTARPSTAADSQGEPIPKLSKGLPVATPAPGNVSKGLNQTHSSGDQVGSDHLNGEHVMASSDVHKLSEDAMPLAETITKMGSSKPSQNKVLHRLEFLVTISDYSKRCKHPAGKYSPEFDGKGAGRWRLLSYTHGTVAGKEGEWLSLYVSSADVDELACTHRWSRTVDYAITLLHPSQSKGGGRNNLSITRRHTSVVFRGKHNDYEWGCRDFLPSSQVLDQGFLKDNDSLDVKVEVELREDCPGQALSLLSPPGLRAHLAWAAENGLPRACIACIDAYSHHCATEDSSTDATTAVGTLMSGVCSEEWGTPLHLACIGWRPGNATVVTVLLDCGAPVDALNKHGETPLVLAAREGGQPEVVAALLDRGANPCLCSKGGWSPMSAAASRGREEVVRLLALRGAPLEEVWPPLSALLEAAKAGHSETALSLLECGADPEVQDEKGNTALWILLEKNITDAALTMVQRYHASVAQCSRERSKVQRAKLLLKHAQRRNKPNLSNMVYSNPHLDDDDPEDGSSSVLDGWGDDCERGFMDHDGENDASKPIMDAEAAALDLMRSLEEEEKGKASKSSKNRKKKEKAKRKKQQQQQVAAKTRSDQEEKKRAQVLKKQQVLAAERQRVLKVLETKERERRVYAKKEWARMQQVKEKQVQENFSEKQDEVSYVSEPLDTSKDDDLESKDRGTAEDSQPFVRHMERSENGPAGSGLVLEDHFVDEVIDENAAVHTRDHKSQVHPSSLSHGRSPVLQKQIVSVVPRVEAIRSQTVVQKQWGLGDQTIDTSIAERPLNGGGIGIPTSGSIGRGLSGRGSVIGAERSISASRESSGRIPTDAWGLPSMVKSSSTSTLQSSDPRLVGMSRNLHRSDPPPPPDPPPRNQGGRSALEVSALEALGQLGTLLNRNKEADLVKYAPVLAQHDINYSSFLMMAEADLRKLGLPWDAVAALLVVQEAEVFSGVGVFDEEDEEIACKANQAVTSKNSGSNPPDVQLVNVSQVVSPATQLTQSLASQPHVPVSLNPTCSGSVTNNVSDGHLAPLQPVGSKSIISGPTQGTSSFGGHRDKTGAGLFAGDHITGSLLSGLTPAASTRPMASNILVGRHSQSAIGSRLSVPLTSFQTETGDTSLTEEEEAGPALAVLRRALVWDMLGKMRHIQLWLLSHRALSADALLSEHETSLELCDIDSTLVQAVDTMHICEHMIVLAVRSSSENEQALHDSDRLPHKGLRLTLSDSTALIVADRLTPRTPLLLLDPCKGQLHGVWVLQQKPMKNSNSLVVHRDASGRYPRASLRLDTDQLAFTFLDVSGETRWFGVPGTLIPSQTRAILSRLWKRPQRPALDNLPRTERPPQGVHQTPQPDDLIGCALASAVMSDWVFRGLTSMSDSEVTQNTDPVNRESASELEDPLIPSGDQESTRLAAVKALRHVALQVGSVEEDVVDAAVRRALLCCRDATARLRALRKGLKGLKGKATGTDSALGMSVVSKDDEFVEIRWSPRGDGQGGMDQATNVTALSHYSTSLTLDLFRSLSYAYLSRGRSRDRLLCRLFLALLHQESLSAATSASSRDSVPLNVPSSGLPSLQMGTTCCEGGFELVLPVAAAEAMRLHFGVTVECLASPVTRRHYGRGAFPFFWTLAVSPAQREVRTLNQIWGALKQSWEHSDIPATHSTPVQQGHEDMAPSNVPIGAMSCVLAIPPCWTLPWLNSMNRVMNRVTSIMVDNEADSRLPLHGTQNLSRPPVSFIVAVSVPTEKSKQLDTEDPASTAAHAFLEPSLRPFLRQVRLLRHMQYHWESRRQSETDFLRDSIRSPPSSLLLCWLQNDAAARLWPVTDESVAAVCDGFALESAGHLSGKPLGSNDSMGAIGHMSAVGRIASSTTGQSVNMSGRSRTNQRGLNLEVQDNQSVLMTSHQSGNISPSLPSAGVNSIMSSGLIGGPHGLMPRGDSQPRDSDADQMQKSLSWAKVAAFRA